jgi:predicted nucleotidyltransferase
MRKITLTDLLIERKKREEKFFKNYLYYGKKIKKEAEKILGKVRVLIFGSILREDEIARDIDVLIISPKLKKTQLKNEIRLKIQKKLGPSPFELHLIRPKEYQDWYKNFIKEFAEI